ncbi:MAG: hypothetical protein PHP90_13655, partial [Sulfuricurvum sp.]|nr:hypothetical protein [Sulfuricurvum sp.]
MTFAYVDQATILVHELSHVALRLMSSKDTYELDTEYNNARLAAAVSDASSSGIEAIIQNLSPTSTISPKASEASFENVFNSNDHGRGYWNKVTGTEATDLHRTGYYADGDWVNTVDPLPNTVNVSIIGNEQDNSQLSGGAGNDFIDGGMGNDTLRGGGGIDILDGGNDTAQDLLYGGDQGDLMFARQNDAAFGESGNDIIICTAATNVSLGGGADYDYYFVDGAYADINDSDKKGAIFIGNIKLTGGTLVFNDNGNWTGTWKGQFGEIYTLKDTNIEVKLGGTTVWIHHYDFSKNNDLDISLYFPGQQSSLISANSVIANSVTVSGGVDSFVGDNKNNTFIVDNVGDTIAEQPNAGYDTVLSSVSYTLSDNLEMLVLMEGSTINATGNALDNFLMGNSAGNVLNGGAGTDIMIGKDGNDTYYVDDVGDRIIETSSSGGIDTVVSTISWKLGENIEILRLLGTGAIDGMGNILDNTIYGDEANNVLDGGTGNDTAVFSGNSSNYSFVKNSDGSITVTDKTANRDGVDRLINIEQLKFSDTTLQATSLVFTTNAAPTS